MVSWRASLLLVVIRALFSKLTAAMGWQHNSPSMVFEDAIHLSDFFPGLEKTWELKDRSSQSFPGDHASVLLIWALFDIAAEWQVMLMLVAGASIVLGNLAAIAQQNIKRMLAYSSIAHAGFVLVAVTGAVTSSDGLPAGQVGSTASILFYLVAYGFATIAAFAIVTMVRDQAAWPANGGFCGAGAASPGWAALR